MISVGAGVKLIRFNLGDDVCLYVAAASKSTLRSLHDRLFIFTALNCSRQTRPERRSRVNLPSKQRKGRRSETRCAPKTKRQHSACKQELGQKCAEKSDTGNIQAGLRPLQTGSDESTLQNPGSHSQIVKFFHPQQAQRV